MSDFGGASRPQRVLGWVMLVVGVSVFAVRLQHAGPYALPRGGVTKTASG